MKTIRYILTLFIIHFVVSVSGQEHIKKYVKENATQIFSIEPDSTDYSDLEVIGKAIGDATVVMLGEQDHGDAPTFLAKTRLIKYLHEKKGFNVLAFLSDFFALNMGWDNLKKEDVKITKFLLKNIYSIWTYCDACKELFYDYIPSSYHTSNPLIVSGFDNQIDSKYLSKMIDSVLKKMDLPITKISEYSKVVIPMFDSISHWYDKDRDSNLFEKCDYYLKIIKLEACLKLDANDFWILVFENLIQLNLQCKSDRKKNYIEADNIRDKQMAVNLRWLVDHKFPDQKIIVWAANTHISKDSVDYQRKYNISHTATGYCFTKDSSMMKKTYCLGFTSYKGMAGRLGWYQYKVAKPHSNSLEKWINKKYKYSFVDFKSYNNLYPESPEIFYLSGYGMWFLNADMKWTKVFDGVFFIREMYPCKWYNGW